jgi:SNF2 family DNA or RNA helicase
VAQIQTGSLGITLTAADTVIFYSTTFGYADYEQAKARVHRVGQCATSVTYIHLLVKESIDEDILAALREKRDVAEYIVDKLKRRAVAGKGLYSTTPIAI